MADLTAQNKWEPLATDNSDREKIWSKSRTFAGDVWFRFRRKPTAIAGFVIIIALMLFALVGPLFTPYDYSVQNLEVVNVPPVMKVYQIPNGDYLYITTALKVISVTPDGKLSGQLRKVRDESDKSMTIFDADGTEVALYYGGSPYVIADEATGSIYPSKTMLNKSYILGTDALGRDVLTRLMYGTRISMLVALMAAFVNLIIGILYGGISGYLGGTVDMIMMRIVDIISTIPLTLYVILIMQVLGAGIQSIIVALGSVYWVDMARVVRGQILSLKQQEFVLAAKTIGSSATTILFDHLIPNALGSILVTITMLIPSAIFMEAFLGYLGIGLQPPLASLGTMCNDASANLRTSPHELLIPALMICVIMLNRVGLTAEHAGRYAHEFSGGQRQRVGIARALVLNPALVICDEPISALDVSIQAQVVNLLRDYQQAEGTSYLFIAHDLSMVRYVSDDIGVMYLGQLVESSDSEEIYKNPLHPYTKGLLSCIPIADPKLARAHASAGVEGDLPSPVNPKPGCRFCGRCPYAKPICSEQTPAMKEAAPGHFVACHLY